MIQLYYFDWKGTKEELEEYCSRYRLACEKHGVVFKGPLATVCKDPRTHASPAHGQKIIATHLDRMEKLLKKELTQINSKVS